MNEDRDRRPWKVDNIFDNGLMPTYLLSIAVDDGIGTPIDSVPWQRHRKFQQPWRRHSEKSLRKQRPGMASDLFVFL